MTTTERERAQLERRVALHEAGHYVMSLAVLVEEPRLVTIEAGDASALAVALGNPWMRNSAAAIVENASKRELAGLVHRGTREGPWVVAARGIAECQPSAHACADGEVMYSLAGLGAEVVFCDGGHIADRVDNADTWLLTEDGTDLDNVRRILDVVEPAKKRRWQKRLLRLADRTEELLRDQLHHPVEALAQMLLERRTLTSEDIPVLVEESLGVASCWRARTPRRRAGAPARPATFDLGDVDALLKPPKPPKRSGQPAEEA